MKKIFAILQITMTLLCSHAYAWGERGHHVIGYTAAQLTNDFLTQKEKEDVGLFFETRKIIMGHLNNIPDIAWKDSRLNLVNKLNGPTHYFDAEHIVGKPGDDLVSYQDKIRKLDTDFSRFMALYNNKPSALNNKQKNIKIFADVGVAPFRIAQLYEKMVSAFKCADKKKAPKQINLFKEPVREGDYTCTNKTTRYEDLSAAIQLGGVMGHFVADLAQPLHTTIDYDGYSQGQGGAHAYFETHALHYIDEKLLDDVSIKAHSSEFQKSTWEALKLPPQENFNPAKIAFHLIANSNVLTQPLYDLDKKFAVLNMGTIVPFGLQKKPTDKDAVRRPPQDPQVLQGLRSFAVDRLAIGSLVLARLWIQAWREGGSPKIKDPGHFGIPYPLTVPFVLPQAVFVKETLKTQEISLLKKQL